jgi:hypothetical protein
MFYNFLFVGAYLLGLYSFFRFVKRLSINDLEDSDSEEEVDPVQEYLDIKKREFDLLSVSRNMNIGELVENPSEEMEEEWKRRILMESTPRGNVIMYYDIYRNAFAYFSDQQISYPILNACAMKYVRIYRCYDFFIDTNLLPEGVVSPLILNIEKKEKEDKLKQEEKKKKIGIDFKDAPFIKSKDSNISKPNTSKPLIYKNTFRYLGKTNNFSILKSPQSIKSFKLPDLNQHSEINLHYKNFKKLM